jgi:NAD(P)-dependent dehydrogenase (short-subunit alcohol dehydrogenase family)
MNRRRCSVLLKARVAIVTGGNWGIGRRICLEFAREGADIVRTDRDPNLQEAIDRFAKIQAYLAKYPFAYKGNPKILSALRRVVQLAPSHFSARYLINAVAKKTPRHLTASTSFEETFLAAQEFIPFVQIPYSLDRYDVHEDTYKNARTRLANLEPVVHQKALRDMLNKLSYDRKRMDTILRD